MTSDQSELTESLSALLSRLSLANESSENTASRSKAEILSDLLELDLLSGERSSSASKAIADSGEDEREMLGAGYTKGQWRRALEARFLTPPKQWTGADLANYQMHWDRQPSYSSLLPLRPTPALTSLTFVRAGLEGRVVGHVEHTRPRASFLYTSKNSTSLSRAPAKANSFVRGRSGFSMFAPGGLEDEVLDPKALSKQAKTQKAVLDKEVESMIEALDSRKGLRHVPPGFERGLFGTGEEVDDEDRDNDEFQAQDVVKGLAVAPIYQPLRAADADQSMTSTNGTSGTIGSGRELDAEIDELLPDERPHFISRRPKKSAQKRDWAHVVDINKTLSNFSELVPEMAHSFPFELDNFQKEAVYHLEQGDSVFVAAHTSAGKTVVAEYAIALAQKHMTRCIYTSPIKALSNQKFRDFKEVFGAQNVGILTGDVQINPEAPCLIMTTEILRSMLYRGADLIRDVEFVIFDEVHYVNDSERGVVWEEVIILCPSHINLILLSATVPNTKEFADWVGRTKKKDVYVISTPKRPVPLEHFLYANRDIYKIVDAKGQFLSDGLKAAGEAVRRKQDKEREAAGLPPPQRGGRGGPPRGGRGGAPPNRGGGSSGGAMLRGGGRGGRGGGSFAGTSRGGFSGGGQAGRGDKNLWIHMIGMLRQKKLLPVVVFVFSKKRCEEYAGSMPNTDLCTAREKSEIHIVIERSLTRLKGTDRKLPQIERMRDLLSRGVGVHHGGLLPIVKEVVEILFQRGLVKALFATETFAMGVNMPARSVVFSGTRKHDGTAFRDLLPGEYTQMSGRAGRRGLDPTGVVIINAADQLPESGALHKMLLGQPTKLSSQFRLTYNMILNLLRVEALKVEEMIKRSFSENAAQKLLPEQQKKVVAVEKQRKKLPQLEPQVDETLSKLHDLSLQAVSAQQGLLSLALNQQQGGKNFRPGRVVILRDAHFDNDLAVIVQKVTRGDFLVLAAVSTKRKSKELDLVGNVPPMWPPYVKDPLRESLVYDLREVPLSSIALLTKHSLELEASMILAHRISAMQGTVNRLIPIAVELAQFSQVSQIEVDWSKIRRLDFQEMLRARDNATARFDELEQSVPTDDFVKNYGIIDTRKRLDREIAQLNLSLSDQNLDLLPDYEQRVAVLKALRFVDPLSDAVLLKGRVACEINSANERELVLTELILDNMFATYTPEEAVALLSVFVFSEKSDVEPKLPPKLAEGYATVLAAAERVSAVQVANRVNFEDYAATLKTALVEVVYEWARGMTFEKITGLTDVAEGTIVRVITRLDETCREVRDAARVIGDADLFTKMEDCQALIRRDIVFAASLYF